MDRVIFIVNIYFLFILGYLLEIFLKLVALKRCHCEENKWRMIYHRPEKNLVFDKFVNKFLWLKKKISRVFQISINQL